MVRDNEDSYFIFRKYICVLFYSKYRTIRMLIRKLSDRFYLKRSVMHLFSFIQLLVTILSVAHIFACLWCFSAL